MKLREGFSSEKEKLYLLCRYRVEVNQIRKVLIAFSLLYAFFGLFDYFLCYEYRYLFFYIRFYVVIPLIIITIYLSYKSFFVKIYQQILLIDFIVAGAGVTIMLILKPDNVSYYGGMFMVYFSGYFLVKLKYTNSVIGGWTNFLIYIFGFFIHGGSITIQFISSSLFFIGANIIGMLGSYNLEFINRKNFLQGEKIEEYNKNLENKIRVQVEEINDLQVETVFVLARLVESRDNYTGSHIVRVSKYCKIISEEIDEKYFDKRDISKQEFVDTIEVASVLHDIGKVSIEDSILNKKGKLTYKEFEQMKKHTIIGNELLKSVTNEMHSNKFIDMGVELTRHHHEKFDGSGYPDGLKGENIPLSARIMAIADVYDALTSKRSYKEAFSNKKAIEIIKSESGKYFDPHLVTLFLRKFK